MKKFEDIISNIIEREFEVRSKYIDKMIERNYPDTITMNIEEKRKFLIENNLTLHCDADNAIRYQVYLCKNEDDVVDGFEIILDYDEDEIIVNENIL